MLSPALVDNRVYTFAVQMDGESRLKKVGKGALVPIGFVAFILVAVLVLRGMVWASDKALPWLITGSEIAIVICVFVLLPLCIFRTTRSWAGVAFVYTSYLFGLMLFAYSCVFVVYVWGYVGLVVGLIFAGVGVVPVALLAALLHAEWPVLLQLVVGIVLTFGTRFLGLRLSMIRPTQDEMQHRTRSCQQRKDGAPTVPKQETTHRKDGPPGAFRRVGFTESPLPLPALVPS